MSDGGVKARRYDNRGRSEAARLARARVIDAAHELLLDRGYARTTIADVAARAGVSAETVYKGFGGKAALVKAVYDVRLAGDDEDVPMARRPAVRALLAETDPRRRIERYAALAAELAGRAGPLVAVLLESRGADADLAGFARTVEAERLAGAGAFVTALAEAGGLRAGLEPGRARDAVWALISPELYVLLVLRRGWSGDDYRDWLATALLAALT